MSDYTYQDMGLKPLVDATFKIYLNRDYEAVRQYQEQFVAQYGAEFDCEEAQLSALEEAFELRMELPERKYWKAHTPFVAERVLGELCDVYIWCVNYWAFCPPLESLGCNYETPGSTLDEVNRLIYQLSGDSIKASSEVLAAITRVYKSIGATGLDFENALYVTIKKVITRRERGY